MQVTIESALARVNVVDDGCWLYEGKPSTGGYARVKRGGQSWPLHRLVYVLLVGPVPEGLELDHLCRVRHCCNPAHLEPVTHAENLRRGVGTYAELAARTATRSHCKNGHLFNDANTRITADGYRVCRQCNADKQRSFQERRRKDVLV